MVFISYLYLIQNFEQAKRISVAINYRFFTDNGPNIFHIIDNYFYLAYANSGELLWVVLINS